MGVTLRATTLVIASAGVTLSSAANANYRHEQGYDSHIRWCSTRSAAFGLSYFYPCGRSRYSGSGYRAYSPNRYVYGTHERFSYQGFGGVTDTLTSRGGHAEAEAFQHSGLLTWRVLLRPSLQCPLWVCSASVTSALPKRGH